MIYFDNAATTLRKPPQVCAASDYAMKHFSSPGRGGHDPASSAAEAVCSCRCLAGKLFDAGPEQVVSTMNATRAQNIAIASVAQKGDEVVISGFEHNAVRRPLHMIGANTVVAGRRLFDPEDTLNGFEKAITPNTKAVVCTHVSNVFGYVLPIEQIAALCRRKNVPLVIDASQSAGILPLSLKESGAAFIAMPGHKSLYGPQGTGILLCTSVPKPLMAGGTGSLSKDTEMPDFLPDAAEAGTHNVPGINGLSEGLRFVLSHGIHAIRAKEEMLKQYLAEQIRKLNGYRVYDDTSYQTGVLSFRKKAADCESIAQKLAEQGICVRAGLHCSPLAHESAGTLDSGTVRVSFCWYNTIAEADEFVNSLKNSD
ncbi:MAG: aminotransferase class V-fold PLP-dependent enzyme [Clostridia bacterium]|nr:aminotransferase class V-fold PLP-dependent enzyme [Clostridia bacterium]